MIHVYDGEWESLKRKLCAGDVIEIDNIQELFNDFQDMKEKVEVCTKLDIALQKDGNILEMCMLCDLLSYAFFLKKEELNAARNIGIKKALEKKRSGNGNYGRPCIDVPQGFNDMILQYEEHNKPLEEYRKQIDMKRSTFYKYAKKAKASI